MDANEESKISMMSVVKQHLDANPDIVAKIPAFSDACLLFKAKVIDINNEMKKESAKNKGFAIDKTDSKKELATAATAFAAGVFAFASATSDKVLKEKVNFTFSELLKTKDDELGPKIAMIITVATENIGQLEPYGINQGSLTDMAAQLESYQEKVPAPRNAAVLKKTVRSTITTLIKEADLILKEQMDKTALLLKTKYPEFYESYKSSRILIDPAVTTTQLKGSAKLKADGSVLQNVSVTIDGTQFNAMTDEKGAFVIKNIPFGNYTVTATYAGHQTNAALPVKVKRGQINRCNFLFLSDNS